MSKGNTVRPITDTWILARSKVKFHGAYPAGFLHRARALLGVGINDPVLHVCSGRVKDYPYKGFGPNDKTVDLDASLNPDFVADVRDPVFWALIHQMNCFKAMLIDRPYTLEDADKYAPGRDKLPTANELVRNGINAVRVGTKVGILDYLWPQPPKNAKEVAVITVVTGRNNRARLYCVFERLE